MARTFILMIRLIHITVMIIILIKTSVYANILKSKPSIPNVLNDCMIDAIIKLFLFENNLIINYDNNNSKFDFSTIKNLGLKFSISIKSAISNFCLISNYIIISNKLNYLYTIFLKSECDIFSRFLIITKLSYNSLQKIGHYILERGFVNIAFLVLENDQKLVYIYQYISNCANCTIEELSLIGYCNLNLSPDIKIIGEIQPLGDSVCPTNTCKMRFIRVDYGATKEELFDLDSNGNFQKADSYGGCILEAFAKHYSIEITKADYVSNYNWYNTVQAMDNGFVDISFGPTLPSHHLVSHLDKGSSYTYEEFIFIDTIPKAIPTLFVLIMPLKTEVWICFTGVVISFIIFIKLLIYFQTKRKVSQNLNCLHLLAIYFSQSVHLPKKSGLRIVINLWMIYALLMNAIYNCNFVSHVIKMKPKNLLTTFNELRNSDRKLGGPDIAQEWLYDLNDPTMINLYNRYEIINPDNISYALYELKMTVAQTDYGILKTNMSNFYIIKEKIVSYPLLYYLPKGHPYLKYVSQFMERIRAGNIPFNDCLTTKKAFKNNELNTITMEHLQIIFEALLFCHLLSSILCIVECLVFYKILKKQ